MTAPRTLLDDCFAPGQQRLTHGEALRLLEERIVPVVGEEFVPLDQVAGRILAATVRAERPTRISSSQVSPSPASSVPGPSIVTTSS